MHNEPILKVSSITKTFKDVTALDGVSLSFGPGISGLIGPNGAGKTTLIKIILGLLLPDSGTGLLYGYDIVKDSLKIRRKLGVLHEHPCFPKKMTAYDYLERVKRFYDTKSDSKDLLALVDLSSAMHRKIGTLSAGMYQRLGIAQALIGSPELVILDEPTANIDVEGRDMIIRMIVDIYNEKGVSFIISSHILSELEKVCHNVAFIKQGKVVEEGKVQEIIAKYTTSSFKIITSHPKEILAQIETHPLIASSSISGASSISIKIDSSKINDVKSAIEEIASRMNVTIYAITPSEDLQEAYKEIMNGAK